MPWRTVPLLLALLTVGCGGRSKPPGEPAPAFQPAVALPAAPPTADAPKPLLTFGDTHFRHTGTVISLALHPDGKSVSATALGESFVRVWEMATGKEKERLFDGLGIRRVLAYRDDGKRLIADGSGSSVLILDPVARTRVAEIKTRWAFSGQVAVSPDGRRVAAPDADHRLAVWDTESGKLLCTFPAGGSISKDDPLRGVAFSPNGERVAATNSRPGVFIGPVAGDDSLTFHPLEGSGEGRYVSWPTDNTIVAHHFAGNTSFDVKTSLWGRERKRDRDSEISPQRTPEGRLIGVGNWRPSEVAGPARLLCPIDPVTLLPAEGEELPAPPWAGAGCTAVSRSAMAVAVEHGIFVYDRKTGKPTTPELNRFPVSPHAQLHLRFLADGRRVSVAQDPNGGSAQVWDIRTGQPVHPLTPDTGWLGDHSPTSKWVVSASWQPPELTVRDAGTGKVVLRLEHPNPVRSPRQGPTWQLVGFPADDAVWVMDGPAGEFRLLQLPSGKVLRTLDGFKHMRYACLSPDRKRLAVSGWDAVAVRPLDPDGKWEILDRFTEKEMHSYEHATCGTGLNLQPHAPMIGFSVAGELVLGDAGELRESRRSAEVPRALPSQTAFRYHSRFSRDDRYTYTPASLGADRVYRGVAVTEAATGLVVGTLPVPTAGGLVISPDGTRMVTSNADTTISVWDLPALEAKYLPAGPVDDYWAALASADPKVGYSAVRRLAADPKAVEWLRECYAKPRAKVLEALIADLDNPDEQIVGDIQAKMHGVVPAAKADLKLVVERRPGTKAAENAARILVALKAGPYEPWAGLTLDQVRDVRAVEVLERVGTAEAKDLLGTWAKHESAVLRLEAAAALTRPGQKR
jgi:WD40 repeat protein